MTTGGGDGGYWPGQFDDAFESITDRIETAGVYTYSVTCGSGDQTASADIDVEIVDLRTIRPLDIETILESVKKTGRLVIVEESFPVASIASEVGYRVQRHAFDYLDAPIRRLCQSDTPFAFSTTLIEEALPQVADIVRTVKEVNYVA